MARPTAPGRLRIVTLALLLVATAGCQVDAPGHPEPDPFTDSLPLHVDGLDDCSGLERRNMVATDSGSDLPGLQLPCLNEESRIDLTALGQRPTLINLWATWCGPCRKEMPRLARAAQANQSVQFLGVNTKDDPELAAAFLAEAGVTFPQLVDIEGALLDSTRIRGLPVTLAIDVDGRIVDRSIGEVSDAELATLIATLGNTG